MAENTAGRMGDIALTGHRTLLRTGLALANIFAWIFVFQFFYEISGAVARSLAGVLLLYALSQLVTIVLTPMSATHLRRGVKQSLVWGALFCAIAYVFLGASFVGYFNDPPLWGIIAFAVSIGVYRALYWVPYRVALSTLHATDTHLFYEFLIALMPLFASLTLISVSDAPSRLLFGAAALILLSILPALYLPRMRERFSWGYGYTFAQVLRSRNSALALSSFLDGMQGAALFLVWPLAVFLIVDWSYAVLGLVFTLTLLAVLLLRRFYARFVSFLRLEESPTVHAVFTASGWVARLAAGTPAGIIVADVYAYASLPLRGSVVDPFVFEHASDKGSFVDEYTALKEIALAGGRIALCIVVGVCLITLPLLFAFAAALGLAAFASGLSVFLNRSAPGSVS